MGEIAHVTAGMSIKFSLFLVFYSYFAGFPPRLGCVRSQGDYGYFAIEGLRVDLLMRRANDDTATDNNDDSGQHRT